MRRKNLCLASIAADRLCLAATLAFLVLLIAPGTLSAVTYDIVIGACPATQTIPVFAGTAINPPDEIAVTGAGNISWSFDEAPTSPCVDQSTGANTIYNCEGVILTFPGVIPGSFPQADTAEISGTPTTPTNITGANFTLLVSDSNGSCLANFVIVYPFDLVFVLDRSGSMTEDADGVAGGDTRWQALRTGAEGFAPLLETVAPAGSQFGLTMFESNLVPHVTASFPGLTAIGSSLDTDLVAELSMQNPFGGTAMGKGIKDGDTKLATCSRPRVVVLFTDGEQNVSPEVTSGTGYDDGTDVNATCPAGPQELEIVSVGIMNPGSVYHTTLEDLATSNGANATLISTGGVFGFEGPINCAGTINQAFNCAVVPALKGNSPQLITSAAGTLSGAGNMVPDFEVNARVSQLLIQLAYDRRFEKPTLAQVAAGTRVMKDGSDVTAFFRLSLAAGSSSQALLSTDFADRSLGTMAPEGTYSVEFVPLTDHGTSAAPLDYDALVIADDHRLGMDWRIEPASARVNEPFAPTMSLDWRGDPVDNATIDVLVLTPGDDLGDLLARTELTVDLDQDSDSPSPGVQKFNQLLGDPDFLAKLLPAEQQFQLASQGNGSYSASFTPTVSGVHSILYTVRADGPFGKVQRQAAQSVYARFHDIDMAASNVTTTVADNQISWNFRPITSYGRFIGPAQGDAISIDGAGVAVTSITDHQDGSYTVTLTGDPGSEVSVQILDEEIYAGPASDFGRDDDRPDGKLPRWLFWLIVLILLLIVIWVLKKVFA